MKKHILLFCFAFFSVVAISQDTKIEPLPTNTANSFAYKPFRVSVMASPLVSWLSPDTKNLESAGARIGFGGGLFGEKNFNRNVAVGLGFSITQMGGKIKYPTLVPAGTTDTFTNVTYTYKTRYIDIPLMVRLRTDEFGYSRIFFEAGFGLNILWSGKADIDKNIFSNDKGGNQDREINDAKDDFQTPPSSVENDNIIFIRTPLNVGAGWEYAISTNTVGFVGLRYSAGLFDVMRASDTKAYNNFVALNFGIMF